MGKSLKEYFINKRFYLLFALLGIVVLLVVIVGAGDPGSIRISSKPRLLPLAAKGDLSELVGNNNEFAFEMYRHLGAGEANLFFSPYGISQVMVMAYAGARGETANQIAAALHFSQPDEKLRKDRFISAGDREFHSLNGETTVVPMMKSDDDESDVEY